MPAGDKIFRKFLELWHAMPREEGKIPFRRDVGPSLAPALMPHTFLGRVNGKFDIEIRLMGSALEANTNFRLTGTNYFDQLHPSTWPFYERFIFAYRAQPCAGRVTRHVIGADGLTYDLHTLAAPLADDDGTARYIMGVSHMATNHAKSAERHVRGFGSAGLSHAQIVDVRYLDLGFGVPPSLPPHE